MNGLDYEVTLLKMSNLVASVILKYCLVSFKALMLYSSTPVWSSLIWWPRKCPILNSLVIIDLWMMPNKMPNLENCYSFFKRVHKFYCLLFANKKEWKEPISMLLYWNCMKTEWIMNTLFFITLLCMKLSRSYTLLFISCTVVVCIIRCLSLRRMSYWARQTEWIMNIMNIINIILAKP